MTHLDLVVVPTGDKQRLGLVEVHSTDWTLMLIETINECAHTVVPQLRSSIQAQQEDKGQTTTKAHPIPCEIRRRLCTCVIPGPLRCEVMQGSMASWDGRTAPSPDYFWSRTL